MRRKISPKFHFKSGVKNGKFHANFTLLGRSSDFERDGKLFAEVLRGWGLYKVPATEGFKTHPPPPSPLEMPYGQNSEMCLNGLNRAMFRPFRSHRGLLG